MSYFTLILILADAGEVRHTAQVKVHFALEQTMKTQMGRRGIALVLH
jgi:hypothetical protein